MLLPFHILPSVHLSISYHIYVDTPGWCRNVGVTVFVLYQFTIYHIFLVPTFHFSCFWQSEFGFPSISPLLISCSNHFLYVGLIEAGSYPHFVCLWPCIKLSLVEFWQAEAPAGLCKSAGVVNRNPATVAGSYNGSFQFVASASPPQFSHIFFNLFHLSLMVLQLL